MAVSPEFIEDLRQRVPLSDVVARRVKLVRKGRRHSGLCPFHAEKTPSFSVVDDDGFYHCFGCGAHGDAISFLREMDGLEFLEAVERLAEMAGLRMPQSAPQDSAILNQRKVILTILEETTLFFEVALRREDGREAAHYLKQRGLNAAIVKAYRIGYSPRFGLRKTLKEKGFSDSDMLAAGVVGKSDRDSSFYDYFRDRVMFPIENRQGKVIAFGARALGDAQPKYLNSGEGPTFSKKGMLYGWVQARGGLRRNLPLVVVEGYMDVIAVHKSGVAAAVAPLGTALTIEQVALLWKLHDEPVLCFDGDVAGQNAQIRALERILPVLEPGRSARLAVLPQGKDPDDVILSSGVEGFSRIIATSQSLADSLWETLHAKFDLRKPELRAQFWQAIRDHVRSIGHTQVRSAYGDEVESRIATMRNQIRGGSSMVTPRQAFRPQTGLINRHRAVLALLLAHPATVSANFEALSMLDSGDLALESMKKALIDAVIIDPDLDAVALRHHLEGLNFSGALALVVGDDMKSRLPFNPAELSSAQATVYLDELLQLVGGKVGLFSQMDTFRK
ncbi:DNA primase [Candidatus Puniceispirillum sp.]|nr:DNA primase [Candidatus Puniceispirillum sp.]